jgi:CRISPR-associated protein Cas2
LNWIQNSAFEGELTEGLLEELRIKLSEAIDLNHDSIIFYTTSNPKWIRKKVLGIEKSEVTQVL